MKDIMINTVLRTTLSSALLTTLATSANAVELYYSIGFDHTVSASGPASEQVYSTSIDINTLFSSMLGDKIDVTSGQYIINYGTFSTSYQRDLIEVAHEDYTLTYSSNYDSLDNAGPRQGSFEGTDYAYVIEYSRYQEYQDLTGTNNQSATISLAGMTEDAYFWQSWGEDNYQYELESSNFPAGTSGLLEEHYLNKHYNGAGENGNNWFDLDSNLILANNGILDFSFEATAGDINITGMTLELSLTENPAWIAPTSASPVPVPAALYLFGSGLLGLLMIKKQRR
ncbi:MAG TPA: hypothetical protein ENI05_11175 [Porticoccus sp.]|nr:hypothetical protein [Porticoccus sp.]